MKGLLQFLRALLPLSVLGALGTWGWWLVQHPPKRPQMPVEPVVLKVEATRLVQRSHRVAVRSQGVVSPRTRSVLLPEVAGRVIELAPSFRPGGFFAKGALLLRIDPTDYEAALVMAKAEVAACEVVVAEEEAKAQQARESWIALGKQGEPSALLLRTPQLAKARADLASSQARVARAQRDVQRTSLLAPYDGQVLRQNVDVGQFVNSATVLGEVFAADRVEIRLPLPERESRFLRLPQPFRDGQSEFSPAVQISGVFAGRQASWQGHIIRVEGSLDEQTRQITAVAQVEDPYGRKADGQPPLVVGSFVEAKIEGELIEPVFQIPRRAVRAGNEVILILEPDCRLKRQALEPLVVEEDFIIVSANGPKAPSAGALLCLTPIAFPADGAVVEPHLEGGRVIAPQAQGQPPAQGAPAPRDQRKRKS